MTYDEFVTRPQRVWKRILHKSDEVVRIETICMKTTTFMSEKVKASFSNTQEKNYIALVDARHELGELLEEYRLEQEEIRNFFFNNLDEDEADLLEWKYIDNKSISEISDILKEQEQTIRNKISRSERKARTKYGKV